MKNLRKLLPLLMLLLLLFTMNAQSQQQSIPRDTIFVAAKEIITSAPYCGLVTVDEKGQPQIRTMNPFPFTDDFVVWFATSRDSRKVAELKKEPRVCIYYADHKTPQGYVNLMGKATVIDDKELLKKMKRDYWNGIPNWENIFVLIKIEPVEMEVVNYKHQVYGNPGAPNVFF